MISFWSGYGNGLEWRNIFSIDSKMNIYLSYKHESSKDDSGLEGLSDWKNINIAYKIEFKPNCTEYYDLVESKYSHNKLKSKRTLRYNPSEQIYEPVK
jgi:hypothetical protein